MNLTQDLSGLAIETLYETPQGRQVLACIQCGMCAGTCPYGDVMDYPPRRIIAMLRAGLLREVLESDSLLKCVTCYTCMAKCPKEIRLTEVLLPLVKEDVLGRLPEVPKELQDTFENLLRYGNPMGLSPRKRGEWAKTSGVPVRVLPEDPRPVDVLWFVECYPSYHPRGQETSRSIVKLFHALDVDFAILGPEERCAGECIRLAGESGLFDTLKEKNIEVFKRYNFKRIVTGGAHAYDAFRYHYFLNGFERPVEHTLNFFSRNLDLLKPKLRKSLNRTVTYHDSCTLGRHNGFFEEPRALLKAIPGVKLVEMSHNRINSLCCGGGGGGMWLDTYYRTKGMERLSDRRVKEAIASGADVLAVSCPFEVSRFEDSVKVLGSEGKMVVKDVVDLLAESLDGG